MDTYLGHAFEEFVKNDVLMVMGKGLGLLDLLARAVKLYSSHSGGLVGLSEQDEAGSGPLLSNKRGLVFILNLDDKVDVIMNILHQSGVSPMDLPKVITAKTYSIAERAQLYNSGGCFIVTSRILIVDLLESCNNLNTKKTAAMDFTSSGQEKEAAAAKLLDISSITGIIVGNAHRINENSMETFIMRVYKDNNKTGFVKALTDDPVAINNGEMRNIETIMKYLYLSKLSLWPRNHPLINKCLSSGDTNANDLESLDISLSKHATDIQSCLLVALKQTISEIKKEYRIDLDQKIEKHVLGDDTDKLKGDSNSNSKSNNTAVNNSNSKNNSSSNSNSNSNLSLDFALSRGFDLLIRNQLLQQGYNSSMYSLKLKSLLGSIKEVRELLEFLLLYDAPSFYFELSQRLKTAHASQYPNPWIISEAGNRVFASARDRVYKIDTTAKIHDSAQMNSSKRFKAEDSTGRSKSINAMGQVNESNSTLDQILDHLHIELNIPQDTRFVPVVELNNKWRAFIHIIESEFKKEGDNTILVLVKDTKTSLQLQLALGGLNLHESSVNSPLDVLKHISDDNYRRFISHQCALLRKGRSLMTDFNKVSSKYSKPNNSNTSGLKRSTSAGKIDLNTLLGASGGMDVDMESNKQVSGGYSLDELVNMINRGKNEGVSSSYENSNVNGDLNSSDKNSFICEKCLGISRTEMLSLHVEKRLMLIEEFRLKNTEVKNLIDKSAFSGSLNLMDERFPSPRSRRHGDEDDSEIDEDNDYEESDARDSRTTKGSKKSTVISYGNKGPATNINNVDSIEGNDAEGSDCSAKILRHTMNGISVNLSNNAAGAEDSTVRQVVIVTHDMAHNSNNIVVDVAPTTIVLYDMDMSFVRNIEIYQALLSRGANSSGVASDVDGNSAKLLRNKGKCKVYSLVYKGSSEQFRFVSNAKREEKMFESFAQIKETLCVLLPDSRNDIDRALKEDSLMAADSRSAYKELNSVDLSSNSNNRGGSTPSSNASYSIRTLIQKFHQKPIVLVDVREFRCALPHVLYTKGFQVVPKSMVVADYVISPSIGIERKAVDDLYQSFNSGRLYNQIENLCRHYPVPCLLIEFQPNQSFCLQSENDISITISTSNISTKLSVLILSFPSLRILWSRSSADTASILLNLLLSKDFEPFTNIDEVINRGNIMMNITDSGGLDSYEMMDSARDILLSIPGINAANYSLITENVSSISELATLSLADLSAIVGKANGDKIYKFFRTKQI